MYRLRFSNPQAAREFQRSETGWYNYVHHVCSVDMFYTSVLWHKTSLPDVRAFAEFLLQRVGFACRDVRAEGVRGVASTREKYPAGIKPPL